jgi:hypothetical protein
VESGEKRHNVGNNGLITRNGVVCSLLVITQNGVVSRFVVCISDRCTILIHFMCIVLIHSLKNVQFVHKQIPQPPKQLTTNPPHTNTSILLL